MDNIDINSFSTTELKAIQKLLKRQKVTQLLIAEILGITQPEVSYLFNGKYKQLKNIAPLLEKYGIKETDYKNKNIVQEPIVGYESATVEQARSRRFRAQIEAFRGDKTLKETCIILGQNTDTHINNIINGQKPVTLTILIKCYLNGRFNMYYTLFGEGELFVPKEAYHVSIARLKEEVESLRKDKQNQQFVIDSFMKESKVA